MALHVRVTAVEILHIEQVTFVIFTHSPKN
jgi:hypothetical protein